MTAYWLAQGVGVIAFLIGITTFINRDERRFRLQLAVYSAIIGVHFFLMGAGSAGMSAGLNALRTVISLRTRSLWVMTVFILLTLILGLGKLQHAMELLPIIGTVASTWALFRCKGLTVRCVMWCSTACWVTHNLCLGSRTMWRCRWLPSALLSACCRIPAKRRSTPQPTPCLPPRPA